MLDYLYNLKNTLMCKKNITALGNSIFYDETKKFLYLPCVSNQLPYQENSMKECAGYHKVFCNRKILEKRK